MVKDQYSLLKKKQRIFEESQKPPPLLSNFNQSLRFQDKNPYDCHLLAVASKDLRVQVFSLGSLSPHL